jgi:hypothetical protein
MDADNIDSFSFLIILKTDLFIYFYVITNFIKILHS